VAWWSPQATLPREKRTRRTPGDFLGKRPRNRSDQVVDYGECGLLPKRKQASRMVHSQNMYLLLDQTIDNAIRALNNFTDLWIGKFRHNPPRLRK